MTYKDDSVCCFDSDGRCPGRDCGEGVLDLDQLPGGAKRKRRRREKKALFLSVRKQFDYLNVVSEKEYLSDAMVGAEMESLFGAG